MRRPATFAALVLLALGAPRVSRAQADMPRTIQQTRQEQVNAPPPPPGVSASLDSARALRGDSLVITVYSYGPGEAVFEKFGHIALAVRDLRTGQDIAYNWGMFDFNQPNFLGRFLTGDTRYWMAGYRTADVNAASVADNRTIRAQTLALTPVEKGALQEFVVWTSQEENRFYRYDYYRDNCSTRIRDALDHVTNGRLRTALDMPGNGRTWRGETERALAGSLPVYAGIEIALGRRADAELSRWDEAFLPEHLADALRATVLPDRNGRRLPVVNSDTVLFRSTRVPLPTEPPARTIPALLLGLTMAGLIAGLADSHKRVTRIALTIGSAVWYVVGGVAGTLLLLAGTVTKHIPYMGANLTLLQLNPFLLLASLVVPIALLRQSRTRVAVLTSALVALMALLGVLLQLVPGFAQSNGVVLAVTVPVHVALAIAVRRLENRVRA